MQKYRGGGGDLSSVAGGFAYQTSNLACACMSRCVRPGNFLGPAKRVDRGPALGAKQGTHLPAVRIVRVPLRVDGQVPGSAGWRRSTRSAPSRRSKPSGRSLRLVWCECAVSSTC